MALDPEASEGLDCALDAGDGGAACGFPVDNPLRFKFDRWLLPTTATRQALSFYSQGSALGYTMQPDYDPATRLISFLPEQILASGLVWDLVLPDADTSDNGFGFRAFDGSALGAEVALAFRTSLAASVGRAAPPPPPTCADVLARLSQAGCSRGGCHSRQTSPACGTDASALAFDTQLGQCVDVPRMGLSFDDAAGITTTAVNQVAHETQNGPDPSQRVVYGGRFGDQMPIIDSGRPENSYLIYKLLIGRQFNDQLAERANPADPMSPTPLSDEQISHARDEFIRFGPMPPDAVGYPSGVSPFDVYAALKGWIRAGAKCN